MKPLIALSALSALALAAPVFAETQLSLDPGQSVRIRAGDDLSVYCLGSGSAPLEVAYCECESTSVPRYANLTYTSKTLGENPKEIKNVIRGFSSRGGQFETDTSRSDCEAFKRTVSVCGAR